MPRWTCPSCGREFGRARQSHVCSSGCTVDDAFRERPPWARSVYEAVLAHLTGLGPVHVDAVSVGVFLKSDRKAVEVRPRARTVLLYLYLPRRVEDDRLRVVTRRSGDRIVHSLSLHGPEDLDDQALQWLTQSYHLATDLDAGTPPQAAPKAAPGTAEAQVSARGTR